MTEEQLKILLTDYEARNLEWIGWVSDPSFQRMASKHLAGLVNRKFAKWKESRGERDSVLDHGCPVEAAFRKAEK
jgi:hypothetical protein